MGTTTKPRLNESELPDEVWHLLKVSEAYQQVAGVTRDAERLVREDYELAIIPAGQKLVLKAAKDLRKAMQMYGKHRRDLLYNPAGIEWADHDLQREYEEDNAGS